MSQIIDASSRQVGEYAKDSVHFGW